MKRISLWMLFVGVIALAFVSTTFAQDYGNQRPDTTMGTSPRTGTMERHGTMGQQGQMGQMGQYQNQYLILVSTPKKPSKTQIEREWGANVTPTEAQKQAWAYDNKTTYLIVNANSESDALNFIPAANRTNAKVIRLSNFGPQQGMTPGTGTENPEH